MTCRKQQPTRRCSGAVAMIVGAVLLSGCAYTETKWSHPEIPSDQWRVDAAQCKWDARKKAEKEAEDKLAYSAGGDTLDNEQSVDAMFATSDINKRARVLFDRCMASLGYIAEE